MKNNQITITCPTKGIGILADLRMLKSEYQINISAYCADAIRQKLLNDDRLIGLSE